MIVFLHCHSYCGECSILIMRLILRIIVILQIFASVTAAETADQVVIEKSLRRLTLKHGPTDIAHYTIALGGVPVGRKQCQGDNKTPEGQYRISGRNLHSSFHRSLRISYPNEYDRKAASKLGCSPGGDIMIHGLPNGSGWIGTAHHLKDWTLGCIAVTNSEIEEIWRLVPDGTVVKILP